MKDLRNFGLLVGGAFIVIFAIAVPLVLGYRFPVWPWVIAGALVAVALLVPRLLALPYRAWMSLAHVLGRVNSALILFLVFVVVFLPVGLMRRILGMDSMRPRENRDSYRIESSTRPQNHMENPY